MGENNSFLLSFVGMSILTVEIVVRTTSEMVAYSGALNASDSLLTNWTCSPDFRLTAVSFSHSKIGKIFIKTVWNPTRS